MEKKSVIRFFITGAGFLLTLAGVTGCIGRGPAPTKIQEAIPADFGSRVNEFVYHGFNFQLGKTVAEIKKNLGRPLLMTGKEVQNMHYPERTDEMYQLGYNGLRVTVYRVTETKKEIVTEVSITSSRYKVKWELNVGSSIDDVMTVLGAPIEDRNGVLAYQTGEEAPSSVSFFYRRGTVYKIDWNFYID